MTNEEAIKSLKKLKNFHNGSYGTAIDLAIKALEEQRNHDWQEMMGNTWCIEEAKNDESRS